MQEEEKDKECRRVSRGERSGGGVCLWTVVVVVR